ncbi:MAG: L,D-transpeptidase [Sorangiineae bacterium]|nr:L,D-transpeptidase [Polyangiaceae bacterium]MEB2322295.1 L,D-transpeptidase [Sorangiineae bacterium]
MTSTRPTSFIIRVAVLTSATSLAFGVGCGRQAPPGAGEHATAPASASVHARPSPAGSPTLPRELASAAPAASSAAPAAELDAGAPDAPYTGPMFAVTSIAAAVYAQPRFDKAGKLGYIRNGGRVPVEATPVSTESCSGGWYHLVDGGYVCGNQGTTDLNHPQVRFAIRQPDLSDVLPYRYARNAKNGTPLYKSVPSREQMNTYEPYLPSAKQAKEKKEREAQERRDREAAESGDAVVEASSTTAGDGGTPGRQSVERALADAGVLTTASDAGDPQADEPWWQKEGKDGLHKLKLGDLAAEGDDVMAKRMVAGFYVAIDKTFSWNGRTWYKTTKGLVTPADRFWQTAGFKFQGVELGSEVKLPVAWVYGGRKTAPTYTIDADQRIKPAKAVERFVAIPLTGREAQIAGNTYSETTEGTWIKNAQVRIARPSAPPTDLTPAERWVDVNLTQQTLVAYEGTTPVYATLVSSGKKSTIKDKDHSTPTGQWRIREKHITTTMDGDGTAAGDLPYSIEDVPFVQYYQGSYAIHAAFWHQNFGVQMSHGCVNLAPLDAKWVFLFTDPRLPRGWHGIWSTTEHPGSRIVVHD